MYVIKKTAGNVTYFTGFSDSKACFSPSKTNAKKYASQSMPQICAVLEGIVNEKAILSWERL